MKTIKVDLKKFADELGAHNREHLERLHKATVSGVAKSIPMLVEKSPVDTGLYAQSWQFEETEWGAVLGNTAPHAAIIEFGTRPGHRAPIGPLLAWAKRVLNDPSQPPDYSPAVWALAKGTQNKIFARGLLPRNILEHAIPEILENIKQEYHNGELDGET